MTTLVLLHFLGGSARTWRSLTDHFPGVRIVPVDLPGFGEDPRSGYDVAAMADAAAASIAAERLSAYALVGHSMGANIATVLARRAEDGASGLEHLTHLVLIAGSPPAPEPMDEDKRREMLGWFAADPATSCKQASTFIAANVTGQLAADLHERAIDAVVRADPVAWRAWLDRGSREDWHGKSRAAVPLHPGGFFLGRSFCNRDELNGSFRQKLDHVTNVRVHVTRHRVISEHFAKEHTSLQSLPAGPFQAVLRLAHRIAKDVMARVDGNLCSPTRSGNSRLRCTAPPIKPESSSRASFNATVIGWDREVSMNNVWGDTWNSAFVGAVSNGGHAC